MDLTTDASAIIAAIRASKLEEEINAILDLEAPSENAEAAPSSDWFAIHCPADHRLFGFDGSGGEYHMLSDGRILLVDSEGLAGVIAKDFREYVAIATGLESWSSALRFMGKANLAEAREEWLAFAEKWGIGTDLDEPWAYLPDLYSCATPREARAAIAAYFAVPTLVDPFATLYSAINTLNGDIAVTAPDGTRFALFGRW